MSGLKSSASLAQPGEYFSVVRYVKVIKKDHSNVYVQNVGGEEFSMSKNLLEKEYYSASQHTSEKKVTRSEIAHLFEHAGDVIFTVTFRKKIDVNAKADVLIDLEEDPRTMTQAKRRKLVRDVFLKGDLRVLTGRIRTHHLDDFGRMKVVDLEKNEDRLVDPRTIESLIYKGIKYVIKN